LEYCKKTDVDWIQGSLYATLTSGYSKLEDLKHADEYFDRMTKLPPGILSNVNVGLHVPASRGIYFAAKYRWEESNQIFEKLIENFDTTYTSDTFEISTREGYAWALERQGRVEEARVQRDKVQKVLKHVEERFGHTSIQMNLLMPRKVYVGEVFELRLDLVNVARNPGMLVNVEGLLPSGSKVISLPSFCSIKNSSIEMKKKSIDPFQVETIKLRLAILKPGVCNFSPFLFYVDDLGATKTSKVEPITVTAEHRSSEDKLTRVAKPVQFEFESEATEKAFNFLISAFKKDYYKRRLPQEKSGWRTLMEIVKNGGVTMNSMYGRSGRGGKATLELQRLGLVESRFFLGERGRGGSVFKMRIRCEKEPVKHLIDQ